jgi:hypothetical protein
VGRAILTISCQSGHSALRAPRVLERLSTLAGQIGATITAGERTMISVPFRASGATASTERERSVPRESVDLSDGETRHDIRSARESHHGQSGAH